MNKWRTILPPFFLFISTFIVYLHSLSPSVYGGDAGDLLSAIAIRGVPHPSGYPLFTLLGILVSYLPFNATLAWKVELVSALSASMAVVIVYGIVNLLTKNKISAILSGCTLAFFYPFFLYAELAELFSLNNFFEVLLLFLGLLFYLTKKEKYLYLLAFFAGLSLSHHQIIVLLFPSLAILVLSRWRLLLKWKILFFSILLFILGLLPYAYIPIAAFQHPPINWDNASNLHNFIHLVLRLDYGMNKPELSPDHYRRFLSVYTYIRYLFVNLTPIVCVTAVLGLFELLRRKKRTIAFALFLAFFLSGPFFIAYINTGIFSGFTFGVLERFYMISGLFVVLLFPFGVLFLSGIFKKIVSLLTRMESLKSLYINLFLFLFFIIPVSLLLYNFPRTDLHTIWIGDEFAKDILSPLPKNSILFLEGDTSLFNSLYLEHARNFRQDIKIVNYGNIFADSVYGPQREKLKKTKKIDNEALDVATIESFQDTRPVFSAGVIDYTKKEYGHLRWIPYGLVYRLIPRGEDIPTKDEFVLSQLKILHGLKNYKKREVPLAVQTPTLSDVFRIYAGGWVASASYLISTYNDTDSIKYFYEKALSIDPDIPSPYRGLGFYYLEKNDCQKALDFFKKAYALDIKDKNIYFFLYATYKNCFQDTRKAEEMSKEYKKIFHTELIQDIVKNVSL